MVFHAKPQKRKVWNPCILCPLPLRLRGFAQVHLPPALPPPDAGEGGLDLALEAADQFPVGGDQRLLPLQVAHLVAPTPQAKGKIERSFQTFQNRLVTLMAHAGVSDWQSADSILQMEIQRRSRKTLRTTGRIPSEVWEEQILKRTARLSPAPASTLLNLQFSLPATRRVHRI